MPRANYTLQRQSGFFSEGKGKEKFDCNIKTASGTGPMPLAKRKHQPVSCILLLEIRTSLPLGHFVTPGDSTKTYATLCTSEKNRHGWKLAFYVVTELLSPSKRNKGAPQNGNSIVYYIYSQLSISGNTQCNYIGTLILTTYYN